MNALVGQKTIILGVDKLRSNINKPASVEVVRGTDRDSIHQVIHSRRRICDSSEYLWLLLCTVGIRS
jgi:hypothetical protein